MPITMRIIFRSAQEGQDAMFLWEGNVSQKNGQRSRCDCSSEDFSKPKLSSAFVNSLKTLTICSKNKLQQKQSITLDSTKHIIIDLATQLDRITKVSGISLASILVDDLCLKDCSSFIFRWSEKLKCLKSTNMAKVYSTARFRCSEGKVYKDQTLTEDHKDLLWWIRILQSIPKSSVCQEGSARVELLNLYNQWKKGQLKNMLPIMDFIMRAILKEKGYNLEKQASTQK